MLESVRATRAGVCDAALVAVNRRSMHQVTKGMYAVSVVSVQAGIDGRAWYYGFTNETVPMVNETCKSIPPSTSDGVHRDPQRRHAYAKATACVRQSDGARGARGGLGGSPKQSRGAAGPDTPDDRRAERHMLWWRRRAVGGGTPYGLPGRENPVRAKATVPVKNDRLANTKHLIGELVVQPL